MEDERYYRNRNCRERPPCRSEASIERHVSLIVPQANFTPAGCFTSAFLCFLRSPNHGFGSMCSTIFSGTTQGSFPTKYAFPNRVFRRAIVSNYFYRLSIYHLSCRERPPCRSGHAFRRVPQIVPQEHFFNSRFYRLIEAAVFALHGGEVAQFV